MPILGALVRRWIPSCLCGEKKTVTSSTSIEESKQEEAAFKQAASAIEVLFGFF